MVRNVDDLDFCLPTHSQSILDGLKSLRLNPKLSDVILLVGGREIPCHRSVLALCSLYFNAMFTGDFVESISARVEIKEVEPVIMETLIDFAYTGKLTINQKNVEALIQSSKLLQFTTVQKVCTRYLQQQIDHTNCLGIYEFGEVYGCPEVKVKARSFLLENFEAVSQSEEFLQLESDRLLGCLGSELLQVQEEQSLVEAILRWVKYNEAERSRFLPELFQLVHLPLLTVEYMRDHLLHEKVIQECELCRSTIENYQEKTKAGTAVQRHLPCLKKLQEVLVVIGGRAMEESDDEEDEETPMLSRNAGFYNNMIRRWLLLPDFPDYNKWGFSVVALNNDVYVTGGSRGSTHDTWSTTQVWKFDSKEGVWVPIAPMLKPRTNHATAVLNGEIYAVGGTPLDVVEVEHYDPYNNNWSLISPTLKYVSNFTVTGCTGKLYVIGSCAAKYNALTLQCYNPVIDSWSVIASPFIPKYLSAPRCVSVDGVIYLIGDNTKKVYVYNPEANMWQKVQMLHKLHENGGMVVIARKIYVTGGHWKGMEGDYSVEMEMYDCTKDVWCIEGFLPCLWFYHDSCSIFIDPSRWTEPFPQSNA
ncbi:kelch-like protein 30 [Callorhinchus milii]|uniref:Kelch like family member 30 n=1 Tax=Callorhinchus milii TaxID=7868 RepID=A0A4W3I201_CALMI|nr:kelch-like protein 30 [Callorhinchus milii]XP_007905085.1 kelch-like protein 30 [Callorhinchus milii]|eukprot:gi/632934256/ref/XP_007905024.1/ PREDICTED: kelch-like protein 30 [Callorhinchus milii]